VSFSEPSANAEWVEAESFQYEVWTDGDRTLAMHYGAAENSTAAFPGRVTVLLDAQGELLLEYASGTGDADHPAEVLEDCEAIFGP